LFPEFEAVIRNSSTKNKLGPFARGCAITSAIQCRVKNHNTKLCKDYPVQFSKNVNNQKVRSTYVKSYPPAEATLDNPMANFSPVHGKKAVDSMSMFFQFLEQDFKESPGPDVFKAFFQKREILQRLGNGDRFLILFGCARDEAPVCDFGFVRRDQVDTFRRQYVRTPKTQYNMTFDGKCPASNACRAFDWKPGDTG